MIKLLSRVIEHWLACALAASALMLGAAHAFETFGGYAPCTLCLRQREVYWIAGSLALAGLVLTRPAQLQKFKGLFHLGLALVFMAGVGIAAYHAGAEWKWWPGPSTCASNSSQINAQALSALIQGTAKIRPPACDEAAWRMLGLSMAGWNVLISSKLAGLSLVALLRGRQTAP